MVFGVGPGRYCAIGRSRRRRTRGDIAAPTVLPLFKGSRSKWRDCRDQCMTRNGFFKLMVKAAARAGITDVHPHALRHGCGFKLVNQGLDPQAYPSATICRSLLRLKTKMNLSPFKGTEVYEQIKGIWRADSNTITTAPHNCAIGFRVLRRFESPRTAVYGDTLGGAVIVDSPIRSPEEEARHPLTRPAMRNKRVYETFDAALARFRPMPEQLCDNSFIVEFIGRHSLRRAENGWVWKFDSEAMGSRRFGEPVREYLQSVGCRAALIFGEKSALVTRETASYMSALMGPQAPIVEIPEARHHVMLDQPLAFVAALRMLLDSWMQRVSGGKRLYRPISDLTSASWRRILIGG